MSGIAPTGTVQFKDGATNLGAPVTLATVSLGNSVATLTTSSLGVGTHVLTAVYSGDANNGASTSSAVAEVINAAVVTAQQPIPTLSEAMLALLASLIVAVTALRRR